MDNKLTVNEMPQRRHMFYIWKITTHIFFYNSKWDNSELRVKHEIYLPMYVRFFSMTAVEICPLTQWLQKTDN